MLLHSKKGLSLLEVILVLAIIAMIVAGVLGVYKQRVDQGYTDQTINDMMAIADAALMYNSSTASWPATIADLSPAFIPAGVIQNAFGDPYILDCLTGKVSVSSRIPAGLLKNTARGVLLEISSVGDGLDRITVTKREQIGASGRLRYEKKHLYHE